MRALLDTCVIIDVLQGRKPYAEAAQTIFLMAANHHFTGCMSAKSSTDIYYIMHRYTHSDKDSRAVLLKLFSLFEVLDTSGMDCRHALLSPVSDFEDAVMIETASRSEVDCIITRNARDYAHSPVPIYTPEQFIAHMESADTE